VIGSYVGAYLGGFINALVACGLLLLSLFLICVLILAFAAV